MRITYINGTKREEAFKMRDAEPGVVMLIVGDNSDLPITFLVRLGGTVLQFNRQAMLNNPQSYEPITFPLTQFDSIPVMRALPGTVLGLTFSA